MVHGTRVVYQFFVWLFPIAILIQVLFVGLSLFTGQSFWDAHTSLGHMIVLLPIILVILSYLGRLPRSEKILLWVLLVATIVQTEVFAAIRVDAPVAAAFHPVLALIIFALALIVALRARAVVQTALPPRRTTPGVARPASVGEQSSLTSD